MSKKRIARKNEISDGDKTPRNVIAVITISTLVLSLVFMSTSMTGNVIGSQEVSNSLSVILFVIGIFSAAYWFRKK